jgi:hypothetical protein
MPGNIDSNFRASAGGLAQSATPARARDLIAFFSTNFQLIPDHKSSFASVQLVCSSVLYEGFSLDVVS